VSIHNVTGPSFTSATCGIKRLRVESSEVGVGGNAESATELA